MNKKIIIGLVGKIASGKGMAVAYLQEKYGAGCYRYSTVLRDLLTRIYAEHTRDNLIKMSEVIRAGFGDDILTTTLLQDALKDPRPIIIVDGVRRLPELDALLPRPEFVLVEIYADPEVRYRRLTARSENADDQKKTYAEFLADEQRSTEVTIDAVIAKAHEQINNNGSAEELHQQIDALISKYTTT